MSMLFSPKKIGGLEIANRFVHSATYECMAMATGEITPEIIHQYTRLAKGGVGLIIPGYLYVDPLGRAATHQAGIHKDEMIPGLRELTNAVHLEGSRIVFQLVHAGKQTDKATIGQSQIAPSKGGRDLIYMAKPKEMKEGQVWGTIEAFGEAAERARKAGADGVQIHAAHGYLINQFISPFFNKRKDDWGGSDEKRFRFLKEVILNVKERLPEDMVLLVKLNTQDYTPREGITIPLAKKYAKWMHELGIDGLEVSCGTLSYSMFHMVRGRVPTKEMVSYFPWWKKMLGEVMMKRMEGKYDLKEGYNLEAARAIKPVLNETPLLVVGGIRKAAHMEEILEKGWADFISMSRPFIREPYLVKKIREGKTDSVACVSCNNCFAAVANGIPVRCYEKGFPHKR